MLWIRQYICVQQARLKRLAAGKGEKQDFTAEAAEFAEFGVFLIKKLIAPRPPR